MLLKLNGFSVIMTTDCIGGVFTQTLDLARDWIGRGAHVIIATIGPAPRADQISDISKIGAEWVALNGVLDWMAHADNEVAATAREIEHLARQRRVQSVHLHAPAYAAFGFQWPHVAACHSCHATWWQAVHPAAPLPADLAWRAQLTGLGLARADDTIAPSHSFATALANAYRLERTPVPIPNGHDEAKPVAVRMRQGVIAAGRFWDEAKNLRGLKAIAAHINGTLAVIGVPSDLVSPHEEVKFRALAPTNRDEVLNSFAGSQVFVSAALYEPFGLTALEAAQAGLALVLSDIPAHRENWDGVAIFRDCADHDGFARSINQLLAHPEEAEERGLPAQLRARAFTAARMGEATALTHLNPRKGQMAA